MSSDITAQAAKRLRDLADELRAETRKESDTALANKLAWRYTVLAGETMEPLIGADHFVGDVVAMRLIRETEHPRLDARRAALFRALYQWWLPSQKRGLGEKPIPANAAPTRAGYEYARAMELLAEAIEGGDRAPGAELLRPLQKAIWEALYQKGLKKDDLAEICKVEPSRLYKEGGISELVEKGLVKNLRTVGYYRPDAPPPELTID